jgi:hypothetical protein
MQKFSFQDVENSRIKIAQTALLRITKIRTMRTNY